MDTNKTAESFSPPEGETRKRPSLVVVGLFLLVCFVGIVGYIFFMRGPINTLSPFPSTDNSAENLGVLLYSAQYEDTRAELFGKDVFPENATEEWTSPAQELTLRLIRPDGQTVTLLQYTPRSPYTHHQLEELSFSPQGTYLFSRFALYEGRAAAVYDVATGTNLLTTVPALSTVDFTAYWTEDESRLAILRAGSGMDGTSPALFYSPTGRPGELGLVREFYTSSTPERYAYISELKEAQYHEPVLTFLVETEIQNTQTLADIEQHKQRYTFDVSTGLLIEQ